MLSNQQRCAGTDDSQYSPGSPVHHAPAVASAPCAKHIRFSVNSSADCGESCRNTELNGTLTGGASGRRYASAILSAGLDELLTAVSNCQDVQTICLGSAER